MGSEASDWLCVSPGASSPDTLSRGYYVPAIPVTFLSVSYFVLFPIAVPAHISIFR